MLEILHGVRDTAGLFNTANTIMGSESKPGLAAYSPSILTMRPKLFCDNSNYSSGKNNYNNSDNKSLNYSINDDDIIL